MDASTVRRRARVPSRWPAATGRRRRRAQRPFASMMIAIERATSGSSRSGAGPRPRSVRRRVRRLTARLGPRRASRGSDLHDLVLFALEELVDPVHVLVRELLRAVLGAPLLVVADVAVADELLQVVHDVAPDVPDRDAPLLREAA